MRASVRRFEAAVQAAAKTIADTAEARLELGTAFAFQQDDSRQDQAEPIAEPYEQHRPISPVIYPEPKEDEISEIQIATECRVVGGVEITTQDATMQTATDRMIDDAIAMHENFVSRAMDPIGVFGITIVEGQVLPAAEGASSRQAHPIDDGEIDQSAAPDDTVAINMGLIRPEPGPPWSARGEKPPAQHLTKLDQVVGGAHDPNAPGFSAAGFSQSGQKLKNVDSWHAVGIENP